MFKRLFISLLILSTLASEGIVNFPVKFYNMYLVDINRFDFYVENEQSIQEKLNSEAETGGTYASSLESVDDGLFVLSPDTTAFFSRLHSMEPLDIPTAFPSEPSFSFDYKAVPFCEAALNIYDNKDIIFKSSDNSPPQFYNNSTGI